MSEELKSSAGVVLPISVVPSKKLAHPLLAEAWGLGVTDTYAQAVPVSINAGRAAPGLERAIQIVREVAKTQPGYSDEREAIFEALSEAYVEAMAPPCTSAAARLVPVELLERLIKCYEDGMSIYGECEELRALLVQSE